MVDLEEEVGIEFNIGAVEKIEIKLEPSLKRCRQCGRARNGDGESEAAAGVAGAAGALNFDRNQLPRFMARHPGRHFPLIGRGGRPRREINGPMCGLFMAAPAYVLQRSETRPRWAPIQTS